MDVEVYYLRALSYYKTSQYPSAIADFEETLLLNHSNTGNIYWFKAKCLEKTGTYEACVLDYTKALRELQSDKAAREKLLYERGMIYLKLNDLVAAKEDFQNGLLLNGQNKDLQREFARLDQVASRTTPSKKTEEKTATPVTAKQKDNSKPDKNVVTTTPAVVKESKPEKKPEVKAVQEQTATPPVSKPVATLSPLAEFYKDEKRFALVIGNSAYPRNIGVLKNPVNDATDMARELQNSNFTVDLLTNATYGQMRAALLKFKEQVDASDPEKTVALFYFAGHGLQHEQENYLVPVDAAVEFEDDISRYCFPAQRMVLANMERSNSRMNILILDACRNNPFPALNRSIDQGLGEMRRARGSFIAYATAPGSVASDGSGKNGLYTQELLKAMRKPGLTIEQVFKEVRANVLRLSGDKQNTWDSSNITGEFYFKFP
jgi:tetratricopeptide (TPR) repeat protein